MPMDLDRIRSVARRVTPIVLDIYDREDSASMLPILAQIAPGNTTAQTVTLEWWHAFPEMRLWVGDRKSQRFFKDDLTISMKPYEITLGGFDRDAINDDDVIVRAQDLGRSVVQGFVNGKVRLAARPMAENWTTYDGQDMYDTGHIQPDGSTASNLLTRGTDTPARSTDASPTPLEARAELVRCRRRLHRNSLIRNTLVRRRDVAMAVIVRSDANEDAFDELLTAKELDGMPNDWSGKFDLVRDYDPVAGQEASYDVIAAVQGGPRPSVFRVGKEPGGLEFDESQAFRNRKIDFGSDARYGVAAAFWQTTVRVKAP